MLNPTVRRCWNSKPSSVKFHPAREAHSDFYGNKAVRNFIIEFEPDWLNRMGANDFIETDPVLFNQSRIRFSSILKN
jgi:hypothetical protein